jgi:hypothetical protein
VPTTTAALTAATTLPPPPDCPLECSGHGTCLQTNTCECVEGWTSDPLLGCREPTLATVTVTGTPVPVVVVSENSVSIMTETRATFTPEPPRAIESGVTEAKTNTTTAASIEQVINNNLYYIIGGAVGGVVVFALCIALIICCLARKRNSAPAETLEYGSSIMLQQQQTGTARAGYAGGANSQAYSTQMSRTSTQMGYPNEHIGGAGGDTGQQSYAGATGNEENRPMY